MKTIHKISWTLVVVGLVAALFLGDLALVYPVIRPWFLTALGTAAIGLLISAIAGIWGV